MRSVILFFVVPFIGLCALGAGLAVYVNHAAPVVWQLEDPQN
ncbi:MAG: hypothetical protein OEU09_13840 [Rhodospirillales bacterium]|nr:hypothetical protein [Rhodospirillales bacterium]MDH3790936.1 hypothetical protein [Rhodospirillales bacterium]MDH3912370.1 hypothetical protein [Rhodospirillales bacterium]